MIESTILKLVRLAASKIGAVTFRNNVAKAWVGQATQISKPQTMLLQPGDVIIRNARPLHAGLTKGSSDLIGWNAITVLPSMLGKRVAVFTAIETKSKTGRLTVEQGNFLDQVMDAGGIAFVARTPEDVERGIERWKHLITS